MDLSNFKCYVEEIKVATMPEISWAGVYGECVLKQNLPVFNMRLIDDLQRKMNLSNFEDNRFVLR